MRAKPSTVEGAAAACVGNLIPRGAAVLVACSGGADSVALSASLAELAAGAGLSVALGHVDHGLRLQSAAEAAGVQALAAGLGVPCFVERLAGLQTRGPGLEAAAREARYPALLRLAGQARASVVATAHTRRDQAETLLLRLVRGAGPGALSGVRARRALSPEVLLVRPLLAVPRAETEAACRRRGLSFITDPHNLDPARARGRLRAAWEVLAGLNPRLEEALAGAAQSLASEDDFLTALAQAAWREAGGEVAKLRALHPALLSRALLAAANVAGVRPERGHLEDLRERLVAGSLDQRPRSLDLPGGRAVLSGGRLHFEPPAALLPAVEPGALAVEGPGRYAWGGRWLSVSPATGRAVDLERAPFPWTLRTLCPGDRFRPAGGRRKKVAALLVDARIPREARRKLGLLVDGRGEIFFVEGLRGGAALQGPGSAAMAFELGPEMDGLHGALGSRGQSESRSATMNRTPDEELR